MSGVYTGLVFVVVGAHIAYLALLILGGLAAPRWPRLLGPHLVAVLWAAGAVTIRYGCPLTTLEQHLREAAGLGVYEGGFIRHYLRGVIFPESVTPMVVAAIVGLIGAGWVRLASRAAA